MTNKSDKQNKTRNGFTMIEILVATSLALIIMLAVTKLFQQVQTAMNATTATMQMMSSLTNTKMTLEMDIKRRTIGVVRPLPQQNPTVAGYFCYEEGEMWQPTPGDPRMVDNAPVAPIPSNKTYWWPKCSRFIGYDPDNYEEFQVVKHTDKTLGDTDDILSLTINMKEPRIRGKSFDPKNNPTSLDVVRARSAEVIWFMRGNTLYRRVLLIDNSIVKGKPVDQIRAEVFDPNNNFAMISDIKIGRNDNVKFVRDNVFGSNLLGFHAFFDVSVSKDKDTGAIKFNTLTDLERRENRFANHLPSIYGDPSIMFPYNIHVGDALYFLRYPTLQETSDLNWKSVTAIDQAALTTSSITKRNRTDLTPYWDYRNSPNIIGGVESVNKINNSFHEGLRAGEDVELTNVLSFDIKAWSPTVNRFIDLGEDRLNEETKTAPRTFPLTSPGRYVPNIAWYEPEGGKWRMEKWFNDNARSLPCVYDTWTTAYQTDAYSGKTPYPYGTPVGDHNNFSTRPSDDPSFSEVDPSGYTNFKTDGNNWVAPPPYDDPLTGIQVTIRVFEPRSGNIREVRVVMDLTK